MNDFIKLQRETIKKIVKLLKSYEGVEAIFLMGSHAKGDESSFSDVDMGFVFSNPQRLGREEVFKRVADIYPSLCTLWLYDKQGLFLYCNGVRLDLDFLVQEDLKDWDWSGVKVVYDPQRKYQGERMTAKGTGAASKPKWRDEDGDMMDWFFWMFRQAYCYIRRGETNEKRRFEKLYSAQTSLGSIREKLIEMRVYLHGKRDYMSIIDKDFAERMGLTYCDFDPGNMAQAARALFDVFEVCARTYSGRVNKGFPEEKAVAMRKLFDEFDRAKE